MDAEKQLADLRLGRMRESWSNAAMLSDTVADSLVALSHDRSAFASREAREQIPLRLMGRCEERLREDATGGVDRRPAIPAREIVQQSTALLQVVPGHGALLQSVVLKVAATTGYDDVSVRAVILRHFLSDGRLVWM